MTTRREFLRAAGTAAVASALGPVAVARAQSREIKVGIVSAYSVSFRLACVGADRDASFAIDRRGKHVGQRRVRQRPG